MVIVVGLMSGTSIDGIDAALVEVTGRDLDLKVRLLAGETYAYRPATRAQILAVCNGEPQSAAMIAQLDDAIAHEFADAAQRIQQGQPPATLLGSHGQTIFHQPPTARCPAGYTWQLGRGDLIANLTGIPTASNFRGADVAAGGQGAPLVPRVDAALLAAADHDRAVQNLGGIGNVTYLPPRQSLDWLAGVRGWDTGPGNMLIDLAVQRLTNGCQTYDRDGAWAARGTPCQSLVEQWLQQDFFWQLPPKSTGRELFGSAYLERCWQDAQTDALSPADWLATLTELTAASVALNYREFLPRLPQEVLLCGGGSRNRYLCDRLQVQLAPATVRTTDCVGVSAAFKEAIAFAVLAYWRAAAVPVPGNLPAVTGACQALPLGDLHQPRLLARA
ncbi:MAG: anhydro-N-acetylmuramic acid kinase [Spirulinaceae cyanobacterium RM2_2_10]|nr:anhydro-N-acetylmuramic acid kinase [Spirulinaceae cyanobacterium RM2_2_10]